MPRKPKSKHENELCTEEQVQAKPQGSTVSAALEPSPVSPAGTDVNEIAPAAACQAEKMDDDDDGSDDAAVDDTCADVKQKKRRRGKKKKKAADTPEAATILMPATPNTASDGKDTAGKKYNFDKDFWDMKYATTPDAQEWLLSYADVAKFFKATVKDTDTKILVIGCGDAPFSADLYAAGYHNITNCDNSAVCIEKMAKRHPEMKWLVADAAAMDCIEDETFGVVIEKSLIDTFYAAPNIDTDSTITNMWAEVWRVVEPGGFYFSLNFIMDTIEKGMTQRLLKNWSDQIGAAMGRPPWKSVVPVQARASNVPAQAQKHPALLLCTKPHDLSIKQFS